jgi:hypothetical protein
VHASILVSSEDKALCSDIVDELREGRPDLLINHDDNDSAPHDLVLLNEGGRPFFELKDVNCNFYGLRRIPSSFPDNLSMSISSRSDLLGMWAAAGHFFRFLRHSNDTKIDSYFNVSIEAYLLHDYLPDWSDYPIPTPTGHNLNDNGKMTIEASISGGHDDTRKYYGFNILNHSDEPLYVWIFAFEMNDLSIRK